MYEITSAVGLVLFFAIAITSLSGEIGKLVLPLGVLFGVAIATGM